MKTLPVPHDAVYRWTEGGFRLLDGGTVSDHSRETAVSGVSLGLRLDGPAKVIGAIRQGLPVSAFTRLSENMGVNESSLADIAGIARRTLVRRKSEGRFKPDESERVYRIGNLFDMAVRVMGDEHSARQWFVTPKHALGGKSPLEYVDTEPGAREVEGMLGRLEYGVFS